MQKEEREACVAREENRRRKEKLNVGLHLVM